MLKGIETLLVWAGAETEHIPIHFYAEPSITAP
jgi:hypothetical protein